MSTDPALIRDDDDARRDALDVERSFIVQAPAGSGKTELLIQRFLALLATVEHPEEVLAITFTRKAAAEMRVRIIAALRRAAAGDRPAADHERITHRHAQAVLAADIRNDWQLLTSPGRLGIQTLDSLNARIARGQPLSGVGAAGSRIVSDTSMAALYREAATLSLDHLAEAGAVGDAASDVLTHLDNDTGRYVDYLASMLATRDQWLPFIGSGKLDDEDAAGLRQRLDSLLETVVRRHLGALSAQADAALLEELLPIAAYAADRLRESGQSAHAVAVLGAAVAAPGADVASLGTWAGFAELLLTKDGGWRKTVNKNLGFPPGESDFKPRMLDLLESLGDREGLRDALHRVRALPPLHYPDDQWRVLLALFRLLPMTVTELKRLFAERNVSDYIEVAISADQALGSAAAPGDVALLLDYQLRHLLVDEMQDTSSAQYRMLEALTRGWTPGDGRTLFCVGDPMQSIYRFRNAEVGQFLYARRSGIGDVELTPLTLRRNFRSGSELVGWFNRVFPGVLAARDDPERSAVSYVPAVSVPAQAGQGELCVHPMVDAGDAEEAETACGVLTGLLADHPADSVAVLVRSRGHLTELLPALRRRGIDYRAVDLDRVTDLPEIIDALALTRALAHPDDRLAWLALLRAPWLGLDWTDLHAIVRNDTRSTVWEKLSDAETIGRVSAGRRGAVLAFRDRLADVLPARGDESLRDRVERAWLTLGGPAIAGGDEAVDNVYRFLDIIEGLETAGSLPDIAALESTLDEERVSSEKTARLQIMTMHRAKGLQFDHVLLTGLGRTPRPTTPEVLNWIEIVDDDGEAANLVSPVAPRAGAERDPLHAFIAGTDADKDRFEAARLLYVACTRARRSLHLVGNARTRKSGVAPQANSFLQRLWPGVADRFADCEPSPAGGDRDGPGTVAIPQLRRLAGDWPVPHPAALPGEEFPVSGADPQHPVEYQWVGSSARLAGTLVHRWIHLATLGRHGLGDADLPALRRAGIDWLREKGVAESGRGEILDRVETALVAIRGDDRGRWLLEGPGHAELPLTGPVRGRIQSVVIDRVRIDEDGTHWIIDYKTSTHEGGNLDAFLAAETSRYRPQLSRYASLYRRYAGANVRCALYFPLLQAFVEVSLE